MFQREQFKDTEGKRDDSTQFIQRSFLIMLLFKKDYYLITIEIPDRVKKLQIKVKSLPDDWRRFPYSKATQKLGEDFIRTNEYLFIEVPSAVVQGDYNVLINPMHKDFNKVKIVRKERFDFDERLFR